MSQCARCGGSGIVRRRQGGMAGILVECEACAGTGRTLRGDVSSIRWMTGTADDLLETIRADDAGHLLAVALYARRWDPSSCCLIDVLWEDRDAAR